MQGGCAICERQAVLTRHHLIPRTRHRKKRNKREFTRAEVREVAGLCCSCHAQIHRLLTVRELERDFHTVERLRAHPGVAAFAEWILRKPGGFRATLRHPRAAQRRGSR